MRYVFKGEQKFSEFLLLESQGALFETKITARDRAIKKLTILAAKIVEELGCEADWNNLKETLKERAAGIVAYDSTTVALALDAAMRTRRL